MELDTFKPRTLNHGQDEGKYEKHRGSRCLVLMTLCLWLICVILLVVIILLYNQSINGLQDNDTDLTQKKLKLETRVKDLTVEKSQLQRSADSLSQKILELESKITSLSDDLTREASKQGYFFFISHELKSWSESRQYCRDRGADLVIINTEEKQRLITSFAKEKAWIGLSDTETEGRMIWVDNSTLNQEFWFQGEPNNYGGQEDCVELIPTQDPVNNWNDQQCSNKKKGICEKN